MSERLLLKRGTRQRVTKSIINGDLRVLSRVEVAYCKGRQKNLHKCMRLFMMRKHYIMTQTVYRSPQFKFA